MCFCIVSLVVVSPLPEPASIAIETTANTDGLIQIAPDSSIRHELAAGVKEVFGISVDQGTLLRFSIDKGDLVLSTVLYGPTGTRLLEHVSQEFDVIEISFPADVGGMYKIELNSRERAETSRLYELRTRSLTTVTALDRKDSEARQAMARGDFLRADWREASLRQAIERYEKAALIWTSVSDFSSASLATLRSGDVCFLLSEYPEALKRYRTAAALAEKTGDWLAKGKAFSQMGRLYSYVGNNHLAQKYLFKALDLFPHGGASSSALVRNAYGQALSNLGEVNYAKGNLAKSLAQFEQARQLFEHDRNGKARVHLFVGYITGSVGQPEKAVAEISRARDLYREINNKVGEGLALTALGQSHTGQDEDRAIELHRSAVDILQPIGDRHSEAIALNGLGQAYRHLGEYSIALHYHEKALRLFDNSGSLDGASVTTLLIARAYLKSGDLDQALAYYQRCLKLSRAAKKLRTEAIALSEIATPYALQGHSEQTSKQYRRLQKFYETIGDLRRQAIAWNSYGDFLFRIGEKHQALEAYNRALPLSEKIGDQGIFISTLYKLARANRDLGSLEVALSFIKQSLETIEHLRTNVGSPEFRASYFSAVREHFDLCIDILMQLERLRPGKNYAVEALLVSERGRARLLLDLVGESRANIREGVAREFLERERELRGLLRSQAQYQMELSWSRRDSTEITEVANQIAQLRSEYQEVQARLREQNPRLMSLEHFEPLSLEQIQKELLNSDTLLLEYALGDERSYLWAITYNSVHSYELPARKFVEDVAREVYKLLTARQGFEGQIDGDYQARIEASDKNYFDKASSLSKMLLGPVAEQLGTTRLVVITEGALQYIPFDALPVPTQTAGAVERLSQSRPFLIEAHEIVALPSISTLVAIRTAKNQPPAPGKLVAVFADPVFSRNDDRVQSKELSSSIASAASDENSPPSVPRVLEGIQRSGGPARLPHASEEADAISAAAPRGTTVVAKGFEASRESAMNPHVGDYQIVHFATHGFVDSEHPELSSIVLSMVDRNGMRKNGLMSLHDIYSLDWSAELTVLSACQTALGKDIKGEGLVGLTHSFMSAGSKSVVASLWKVDDRATAVLMADFYESMLQQGMSPSMALRSAKLKMMREKHWSAPYYWAGFVVQGEYTNRIAVDSNSSLRRNLILLLLLVLISWGLIIFQRRRRRSCTAQRT